MKFVRKKPALYRPPIHRFPAIVFRVRQTRPKFPDWELRREIARTRDKVEFLPLSEVLDRMFPPEKRTLQS